MYIYHNFFINEVINGHLDYCNILAILSNAAVNIGVYITFGTNIFVFEGRCQEVESLGHMGS